MKRKIKIFGGILLLVAIFLLVSRVRFHQNGLDRDEYSTDQTAKSEMQGAVSGSADKEASEHPTHLTETVEAMLAVDADVDAYTDRGATYSVAQISLTEEEALQLMKDLSGQEQAKLQHVGEDYWLDGEDGSRLCFVEKSLNYEKNVDTDEALISMLQIWDEEHRDQRKEADLSFATMQECETQVLALMQRFTDMDAEILRVNAVDADSIQTLYTQLRAEGEFADDAQMDFSSLGDAYLIYGGYCQDGLAVYNDTEEAAVESSMQMAVEMSCLVRAVVTKDGIRYFDMRHPMKVQEKTEVSFLSAREALDRALESLKNQILTQKITIDHIYMEYVPIASEDYLVPDKLRPYWVIHYQTEDGYLYHGKAVRINAETGEDLAYGK